MNNEYDFSVMIGRFSPWHFGHQNNLLKALEISDQVIIILGSHNSARTFKNPFSSSQRIEYIKECIPEEFKHRVKFNTVSDNFYQSMELGWVKDVQNAVDAITLDYFPGNYPKIALVGHNKDESSFYLNYFPNYKLIDFGSFTINKFENSLPISSTTIRELIFTNYLEYTQAVIPTAMYSWLQKFVTTDDFKLLKDEYEYDINYVVQAHENMTKGIWPTTFYTCDAVIFAKGHVLLIKRKFPSGKNLWATPGGFVEPNETALEGIIRELKEEVNIKVPEDVLRGSLKDQKIFDYPERSLRGRSKNKKCRTVTQAFCFKLKDNKELPKVQAGDDAAEAWWFPINEIDKMRDQMFDDHWSIINYFLVRL